MELKCFCFFWEEKLIAAKTKLKKLFLTCGFIVTGFLLFEKGEKVINDNENLKVKSFTLKTEEVFKFKNLKHLKI